MTQRSLAREIERVAWATAARIAALGDRMLKHVLERVIVRLAERYGVCCYEAGRGYFALMGTKGSAIRGVRSSRDVLSAWEQDAGRRLIGCGVDWDVWWAEDLFSGRIEREIASLSDRTPRRR